MYSAVWVGCRREWGVVGKERAGAGGIRGRGEGGCQDVVAVKVLRLGEALKTK